MTIAFSCPACAHHLSVADDVAGKLGQCPRCRKPLRVPGLGNEVAPAAPPPVPARKSSVAPMSVAFVAGGLVGAGSLWLMTGPRQRAPESTIPAPATESIVAAPAATAIRPAAAEVPAPKQLMESPEQQRFREQMLAFLDDCRTHVNLLDQLPPLAQCVRSLESVRSSFARLPDVPATDGGNLRAAKTTAELILKTLVSMTETLRLLVELDRLGGLPRDRVVQFHKTARLWKDQINGLQDVLRGKPEDFPAGLTRLAEQLEAAKRAE